MFNEKYKKIKNLCIDKIKKIEENMILAVKTREPLESHIVDFLNAPSKRIRLVLGILFLLSNDCEITDSQLELLCAIELVHSASLIHDDIIDEGDLRRGKKSIYKEFGNKLGVISGDYLLSLAMEKISNLENSHILKIFSKTLKQMCIGEINQNFDRYKIGTIEDYIEKSKNKTAFLFETTLLCCAILSKKDFDLEQVSDFGLNFGIAFQIRDDLINILRSDFSKPAKDIEQGIYTAPVIYSDDIQNPQKGIEKTRSLLNNYIEKTKKIINKFPDNIYKNGIEELLEIINNV